MEILSDHSKQFLDEYDSMALMAVEFRFLMANISIVIRKEPTTNKGTLRPAH